MPRVRTIAHDTTKDDRTDDVYIEEDVTFQSLFLSPLVLQGLHETGFIRPSPIQLKAIPIAKCGQDVIAQAKSGTGKTCVFTVVLLEAVNLKLSFPQGLVIAPTREIAVQICDVIRSVGSFMTDPKLEVHACIGGLPFSEDVNRLKSGGCHVIVGTPGRLRHLIMQEAVVTKHIRMFVLDEADKLLELSFKDEINFIYSKLPERKQMLSLSATYPMELSSLLSKYMKNPVKIMLDADKPSLHGVHQCYILLEKSDSECGKENVPENLWLPNKKIEHLKTILSSFKFHQCIIFCNHRTMATDTVEILTNLGWTTNYIYGGQDQKQRMETMKKFRDFNIRVLISSDLTSRGVDFDKVDLVINLDVPYDIDTYLHRVGRGGRYGGKATAISILSKDELDGLKKLCRRYDETIILNPFLPTQMNKSGTEEEGTPVDKEDFEILTKTAEEAAVKKIKTTDSDEKTEDSLKTRTLEKDSRNKDSKKKTAENHEKVVVDEKKTLAETLSGKENSDEKLYSENIKSPTFKSDDSGVNSLSNQFEESVPSINQTVDQDYDIQTKEDYQTCWNHHLGSNSSEYSTNHRLNYVGATGDDDDNDIDEGYRKYLPEEKEIFVANSKIGGNQKKDVRYENDRPSSDLMPNAMENPATLNIPFIFGKNGGNLWTDNEFNKIDKNTVGITPGKVDKSNYSQVSKAEKPHHNYDDHDFAQANIHAHDGLNECIRGVMNTEICDDPFDLSNSQVYNQNGTVSGCKVDKKQRQQEQESTEGEDYQPYFESYIQQQQQQQQQYQHQHHQLQHQHPAQQQDQQYPLRQEQQYSQYQHQYSHQQKQQCQHQHPQNQQQSPRQQKLQQQQYPHYHYQSRHQRPCSQSNTPVPKQEFHYSQYQQHQPHHHQQKQYHHHHHQRQPSYDAITPQYQNDLHVKNDYTHEYYARYHQDCTYCQSYYDYYIAYYGLIL